MDHNESKEVTSAFASLFMAKYVLILMYGASE